MKELQAKLATPISNGGLLLAPPGQVTGSAKAGSQTPHYCLPPMEGDFTLFHLLICHSLPVLLCIFVLSPH